MTGYESSPQYAAELFAAAGHRNSPHPAHFPAAALSIDFYVSEHGADLSPETEEGLRQTRQQLLSGEEIASLDRPEDCVHEHSADDLARIMQPAFPELKRSGHGAILSTVLFKAVKRGDVELSCGMIEGVESLLEVCAKERPEPRYIDRPGDYWDMEPTRPFASLDEAKGPILDLFDSVQPDTVIDDTKYFLNGEKLHVLTHWHALEELKALGYPNLVEAGLGALSLQTELSDVYVQDVPELGVDPRAAAWDLSDPDTLRQLRERDGKMDLGLPHPVKRLYSLLRLDTLAGISQHTDPEFAARYKTATMHG